MGVGKHTLFSVAMNGAGSGARNDEVGAVEGRTNDFGSFEAARG
jgi:hypothetical protein